MTSKAVIPAAPGAPAAQAGNGAQPRWSLQDAKARFSELVRTAHRHGPQQVTVHGRDAVVVVAAQEFQRLQGERTGEMLIEALQACPHRETTLAPRRSAMPVRAVKL